MGIGLRAVLLEGDAVVDGMGIKTTAGIIRWRKRVVLSGESL